MRKGRKSISQTPAPPKDRVKGSKVNPKGSAASKKSATSIELSDSVLATLEKKKQEYNEKHPNSRVSLATLKAVFRRGAGAYSNSHRPTISGGAPNSRSAWAFARVNKFLLKKGGTKVKAAYVQDDDLMANGGEIKLLAPNGKKSNLTPEQYKLVHTPQFKAWFGDWENDPQNASKVVDENGEPLVVYHGSEDLRGLKTDYIFKSRFQDNKSYFFTDNYRMAKSYADPKRAFDYQNAEEGVAQVYLSLQNPLIVNAENKIWRKYESEINGEKIIGTKALIEYSKSNNYDSVIVQNVRDYYNNNENEKKGGNVYVAFEPNQIKLADGSNTTFDANNPDIRYKDGGLLKSLSSDMDNLKENGIVLKDNDESTIVIAYSTENKELEPSHYNKALIYKSVQPIKSASEIIENLNSEQYERFDEDKINEYKKGHLIILNQNEVIYDSENPNMRYEDGGILPRMRNGVTIAEDTWLLTRGEYNKEHIVVHSGDSLKRKRTPLEEYMEKNISNVQHKNFVQRGIDEKKYENAIMNGLMSKERANEIIKSADLKTLYEDGGETGEEITCHNCKWHWNTDDSEKFDKYVCHKCGFDNKIYYMKKLFKDGGNVFADKYPKNEYVQLNKNDVDEFKQNLFDIINQSYAYIGGHIEFQKPDDLVNSDLNFWIGADIDEDPDADTIIGGKTTNFGTKLTASAQDGSREAKISVSKKMAELLKTKGFYAETNKDLAMKRGLNWEKDEKIIRKVVNKTDIKMNEDGSYNRNIGGAPHEKVLVGYFDHIKDGNYKRGGHINPDDKNIKQAAVQNSGATGGLLIGNRHSEGGIKAVNKSSGTPLEMEGGEVVITRDAVSDEAKREFEGEMLTNRQILSKINQSGGGISFADGGDIPEKCSCSGKKYKFGGKVMKDYDIASYINGDGKARRKVLENYYSSIEENTEFAEGGVINGLEDLGDCARSFLVDIKNSGAQFLDYSMDKKHEIKELEDNDLIYSTNSSSFGCLTAFLTKKGKKLMSSIPAHLFKKGGMTDCGCGCGSYKDGGDLDTEKKYFNGVDYDYENQFLVNKAIEELLIMKDASDMTIEEKNFLTYYSGYGGLEKFGATGKGLLYEYFTPPLIAKKMWALAYKHGFEGGLVLEPSCGIGEFIKYAPEQNLVHGYEINQTSAKIASILYPNARIKTDPFEKLFIKNNYTIKGNTKGMDNYSLVIGNPPYGSMAGLYAGMGEKEYTRANNYIDYFILRGLDLLNSGGILIYVIGTEVAAGGIPFLQQGITENKKLIAERADLVDAYRLPNGVFERTDVLTDIVVFKKK
jgi:hypothetical protein